MTTTTATPLPLSRAGQWACTIEDGRKPRKVTMTRHLVDETIKLFRVDGWNYRIDAIETSDQGDVFVTLIRQTRKGHDYRNRLGISTSLADLAASETSSPQYLAGVVARIEAASLAMLVEQRQAEAAQAYAVPGPGEGVEIETVPAAELVEGDLYSADGGHLWHVCAVNMSAMGTVSVYVDDRRDDDAGCVRLNVAADQQVQRVQRPLGQITFYEGHADAPTCPCGNEAHLDGFRPVTVADTPDGKVGVFSDCDGAWWALGRHVACLSNYCLRVWSDAQIADDQLSAPVVFRLARVTEPEVTR